MSTVSSEKPVLKLIIPKGRLQGKVEALLASVGIELAFSSRSYRPVCSDPCVDVKLLKSQNIAPLVALGRHDAGFTGLDWILENQLESNPDLTRLMDLGFNQVKIVAAVPEVLLENDRWRQMKLVVASEYEILAKQFAAQEKLDMFFLKSFGATEALPPEDADMIVDNTSTGSTLKANRLSVVAELLVSTTQFIVHTPLLNDPWKKEKLDQLVMLMNSKLNASKKVLLEMNVSSDKLDKLVQDLPCMHSPTVSPLYNDSGFAVKIAVLAKEVPVLIPQLVARGARDLLEYKLEKLV
ncbi:MAG: ATP phosphoribosyltransferase [Cyanobacteria bacterium P01_H01_bin.74]